MTFVDAFVLQLLFQLDRHFPRHADATAGGVGIPGNWIMPVMSIGQIAEMLTMFILGATLKRLGWRWTMIIGILGHAARFAVYAFFPQDQCQSLPCRSCTASATRSSSPRSTSSSTSYFPKDVRASAQGLFNVMILGIGVTGGQLCLSLPDAARVHKGWNGRFPPSLPSSLAWLRSSPLCCWQFASTHPRKTLPPRLGTNGACHDLRADERAAPAASGGAKWPAPLRVHGLWCDNRLRWIRYQLRTWKPCAHANRFFQSDI